MRPVVSGARDAPLACVWCESRRWCRSWSGGRYECREVAYAAVGGGGVAGARACTCPAWLLAPYSAPPWPWLLPLRVLCTLDRGSAGIDSRCAAGARSKGPAGLVGYVCEWEVVLGA